MKHNYSVGLTNKLSTSSGPFFWAKDDYIKYNRLLSRITFRDKTIGILAIMESKKPFKESDLELASILCNAISAEMQKNTFLHSNLGSGYEDFILNLLEGKIKDKKFVGTRIKNLNIDLRKRLVVFVCDTQNLDKSIMFPLYIRKTLENIIVNGSTIEYNGNVILLLSYNNKNILESGLCELKNYLKKYGMRSGMSRDFGDITDLRKYYDQAYAALNLGIHLNPDQTIYRYEDYSIYHFIDVCQSQIDIENMLHPVIKTLIDFDNQHNTDYLHSLYTYFECSRNVPNAAKKLNLHRNSMFYRMKKIMEIINSDLTDNRELLHIELSFKVLEYNKSEHIIIQA